ncbi:kinase-like protein [Aspergillus pseudonomiae]|uniref:Kinase-like protein n=1 Tax=Aspergillus pseudonomiae TaxID=1506151 RepID=A0A5N7DDL9_9EURO|nr:kinase-like protein [Aspergillus pseudonomiae]KAE8404344.1 kinase-like protein [Aspergillus pseudonomiae]
MARVSKSKAARFNVHTLTKLQAAIEKDPEIDLTVKLPWRYSDRLNDMRQKTQTDTATVPEDRGEDDIRASIRSSDLAEIVFPLSDTVRNLLGISSLAAAQSDGLAQRLIDVIDSSEVVWKGPFAGQKMVLTYGHDIILKAVRDLDDTTEYTTLEYLHQHKPNIPAPKPLGFIRMNDISLMFMTHLHSSTLAEVWPSLSTAQKVLIREQLTLILNDLRSLPCDIGIAFGGVLGEGCKDIRRHLHRSAKPILTVDEFEDFLFTSNRTGGEVFVKLLRQLSPSTKSRSPAIVFTHGDLRSENIIVKFENNEWIITGLIDWEYSGFYPEYYEAIRCTNCMAPYEDNDWYLFIPDCVSPRRYMHWWLLDRVREARVV